MPYISETEYQNLILNNVRLEQNTKDLVECLEEIMHVEGDEPDFENEVSVVAWEKAQKTIALVKKGN